MPPMTTSPRRTSPLTTILTLLPCLLAVSLFTALQHLYHNRRRLTAEPIDHPVLIFRDPRHCLSHPANRVFNVRADRNILASAPLAHCFFEAELVESECRFVARVERKKMKEVLAYMMEVKKGCDKGYAIQSPLPWGTEGTEAGDIEAEWVRRVTRGLRRAGGKLWSGFESAYKRPTPLPIGRPRKGSMNGHAIGGERRDWERDEYHRRGGRGEDRWWEEDEDLENDEHEGWFEVWEGVVSNRCEGWVVEPEHNGYVSLEDDDEDPFTWVNSIKSNLRIFDGAWVSRSRSRRHEPHENIYRVL
ncbi:hypothetical protein FN846DRAFT_904753 [Sphaerosporella brunnea]|uniref:Uncharacterized protein n=1 Tax=Sphaerosporella brunnea TaxID=1250544 RepID=A0A5J5F3D0_9PEZI|nr:hypothetical protein FN846DRAFT_904753 [Sphaerosporella brunnea]